MPLHWIGWSATSNIVSSPSKSHPSGLILSNSFVVYGTPGIKPGPLLFIMYTNPLSSVLSKAKDIKHHLNADDTQVHSSFNMSSFYNSIQNLQNSIVSVLKWMYKNKLKLNPDKTKLFCSYSISDKTIFNCILLPYIYPWQ